MRAVRTGPETGLIAQLGLLAGLAGTVGLSGTAWIVGLACAVTTDAALARALARGGETRLRPADRVTLVRASIVCAVAALVADSFTRPAPVGTLLTLTVVALALDAVDGRIARRTETATTLGARFDMEVDAFLILVLSVYVAGSAGTWVLAIGLARYVFVAAGWLVPWLRGSLPPRPWCKVVAATQGVVLAVAVADVLPAPVMDATLTVSLALLAESFGREVWGLWRHRLRQRPAGQPAAGRWAARRAVAGTALAGLLVWFALVGPNEVSRLTPGAFVRIPLEGLLVVALVLVLPAVAARAVGVTVGLVLGVLTVVKVLDMAFFETLGRPYNPVTDWNYFGPAVAFAGDLVGRRTTIVALVGVGVVGVAMLVVLPLSAGHLLRLARRHRATSARTVVALGAVWVVCAVTGAQVVPGAGVASTSAADLTYTHVRDVRAAIADRQVFADELAVDRFRDTPGDDLLTGLAGKDVLVVFVESYGRVAVEGSDVSARVDAVLDAGTSRLRAAGFSARSAFLTSPTFGAGSWLAHSTLQSGVWVDNELRYADLLSSDRLTLSTAFQRAGWRTVADVPANDRDWPEGTSFYDFATLYDSRDVGYAGPTFSYAPMPDQYTLSAFRRLELSAPDRPPVMAEIDLVSSHNPWTPLPHMVGWGRVGDGSVFDDMPAQGRSPDDVWPDPVQVQAVYAQSIAYSLRALISFVQTSRDHNLVLVVLGDHQPATIVSGAEADHDVPVSIIAHDPAVLRRVSPWGWQVGLRPDPDAPVWPMDAFRDRFLTAYGPRTPAAPPPSAATAARLG